MYCWTPRLVASVICLGMLPTGMTHGEALHLDASHPRASDDNSGTAQQPFATLEAARVAVRRRIAQGLKEDLTVWIHGGVYRLTETVVFGPEDSPGARFTVRYRAASGEQPVFSAGVPITGWRRLEEDLPGLPSAAKGKVWVADVPPMLRDRGPFFTLYDGDHRLPRARSKGFRPELEVVRPRVQAKNGRSVESALGAATEVNAKDGKPVPKDMLYFPPGTVRAWDNLEDVEIVIRPTYPYVLRIMSLASVDESRRIARTTRPAAYPMARLRYVSGDPPSVWVENVPEAFDEPGEWVLRSGEGRLYLWPLDGEPGGSIEAPCLRQLIRVEGDEAGADPVENLVFEGLTFTHADRDASDRYPANETSGVATLALLKGARGCVMRNCRFTNSGGTALRLDSWCQGNRVEGNHIDYLGGGGIILWGHGPGLPDVNKKNAIVGNHVHDCGQIYWDAAGIWVWQSGENRVANNVIHDLPYCAIKLTGLYPSIPESEKEASIAAEAVKTGNDSHLDVIQPGRYSRSNVIENNEIYGIVSKLADGNGILLVATGEGNIIRRNYIHDLVDEGAQPAIRVGDYVCGTLITENIIHRCRTGGITLKHTNDIVNNMVIDLIGSRESPTETLFGYVLLRKGPSRGSMIQRNIFYHAGGKQPFYCEGRNPRRPEWAKNLEVDYNLYYTAADPGWSREFLAKQRADGVDAHSVAADPGFVDLGPGDFRLKSDSPALELGFRPIDFSRIGLKGIGPQNERRARGITQGP